MGSCKEPSRGFNLLALSWERNLSAKLLQSIETPLPFSMAQPGSSIIHPHVWASRTPLLSHLCIAGLTWPPPAPGLAVTQLGGLGPRNAWCGAGNAGEQGETGPFVALGSLGLVALGWGAQLGRESPRLPFTLSALSLACVTGPSDWPYGGGEATPIFCGIQQHCE